MKKMLFLLLAATFALCNCTKQDLDEIRAKQAELDTRLSALEEWQRAINGQIASLQNLFSALEDNDYVTSVSELADGAGYVINFMKGGAITIKNGVKGDKGETGATGIPGNAPDIGVKEDNGIYYWTLDGDYIKDGNGNPLRVTGEQGKQGDAGVKGDDAIAPQVRINADNNEWEISTDNATNWMPTGVKAVGKDGTNGVNGTSCSIKVDDSSDPVIVIITNTDADGKETDTEISFPLYRTFYIGDDAKAVRNAALVVTHKVTEIPLVLPDAFSKNDYTAIMAQIISKDANTDIQTRAATGSWQVAVAKPTFNADGSYKGDAKVTVTMPVGIGEDESALLEVTLVGQDGGKTVSTRALTVPKSGDYYYSDGSVSCQIISGNPDRIPVGIVFYVGDIVAKDSHLKEILGGGNADNYKSDDIHGLVVALKDAGNRTYWQRNYTPTGMSVADANDICGYGNTLQMKEWNEKDSHSGNLIEAYGLVAEHATANPAPAGSSGWYFPSVRELSTLCSGWQSAWADSGTYGGTDSPGSNIDTVNEKLSALSVSGIDAEKVAGAVYWSSSSYRYNEKIAFMVYMLSGNVNMDRKDLTSNRVRAVLAF